MKKRIVFLFVLLACVMTLLCACGTMRFSKVVQEDFFAPYGSVLKEGVLINSDDIAKDVIEAKGDLVLFADSLEEPQEYRVYNLMTDTAVAIVSAQKNGVKQSVSLEYINGVSFYFVTRSYESVEAFTYSLYHADGTLIAESDDRTVKAPKLLADLLIYDGIAYRISPKKGIQAAFTVSDFKEIPNYLDKFGDYYVRKNQYAIVIYDAKLNVVLSYTIPSYAAESRYFGLNNGNVLVQYLIKESEEAEEYTFLYKETKYTMVSVLLNAKKGKEQIIEKDFYVDDMYVRDTLSENDYFVNAGIHEDVENLAIVHYIKDKRVNIGSYVEETMVVMSNKAKIKGKIDGYVEGMRAYIKMIAPNRWVVNTNADQSYLLNQKGKVIGEVSMGEFFMNGIVYKNKIYNLNLKMVCDLYAYDVDEQDIIVLDRSVVFRTENYSVMLYIKGEVKTLAEDAQLWSVNERAFVVMNDDGFTIYNSMGDAIYTDDREVIKVEEITSDRVNDTVLKIEYRDIDTIEYLHLK